ncbi:MAG TPA: ATP-binding protein [Candidatus Cybelea sp.]|jgi:signal transduction histidine kinase|nr:ATP-binding protein [Candidatus Cybelea sp.]
MCGLGLLWSYDAECARKALAQRPYFLAVVRGHTGWGLDDLAAKLIYTELIGNVVRHAPGGVKVRLRCDGRSVLLDVSDYGSGFKLKPHLPQALAESGRGLFLVSQFATRMWVEANANGGAKVIAELPRARYSGASAVD